MDGMRKNQLSVVLIMVAVFAAVTVLAGPIIGIVMGAIAATVWWSKHRSRT